jgi:hypothetical protein
MYRKNTASQYIYFVLVNASSGAALTGATVTAYRALDGGSQASATGTTTELANGQYRFNLSQADTNADYGSYLFTATSAVPVEKTVVFTGADVTATALGAALASNYTATRAGYLDGVLIAANYNQRTVQVTGSNHVAADVHEFQPGVITAGDFAADAITATVIAASAVTEIQSGLATSSGVTAAFTEIKGAGWSSSTDTLEEIADAIAGITTGSGTGARTVNVTVNDGTNPLQNATVRMTNGADTYTALTNASGQCTLNLDDATWVVSITKGGYTFAGTTLVVDGTETVTYSMSLVTITPSSVNKVTGYWTVLDETGTAAASVVVTIKARQPLRGGAGLIHDAGERTATSNGSGLVQFTNLIPGWRYAVVANDDYVADFVVPSDAVTSVELGSIVARLP